MFKIVDKKELAEYITQLDVHAALIAEKYKPGQFVVVVIDEQGERIPLTVARVDKQRGTISLIFQHVGFSTRALARLAPGDTIQHILGPLGVPSEIKKFNTVFCVGGGVGVAELYPVVEALHEAGNRIIGIIAARSKRLLILERELAGACHDLVVATDDGSYGRKGLVTDVLREQLEDSSRKGILSDIGLVYAIGPVPMMAAVAELTKKYSLHTIVSLNPIMVDATGMCGACRCEVAGKTVFGCVDGPEFDAHQVDFRGLQLRLDSFKEQERQKDLGSR